MHLQFVNDRRFRAKQFWYQLIERLRWPDREPVEKTRAKYGYTVEQARIGQVSPAPDQWWAGYEDLLPHFHADAEPWYVAEIKRMLKEHPEIERGCDDFGMLGEL